MSFGNILTPSVLPGISGSLKKVGLSFKRRKRTQLLIWFLLKFWSEMTHTEETHKYDLFEQNEQFLLFTFISVTVWNIHTCTSWLHSIENNLFHQVVFKIHFKPRKGFVILIWCCCRLCVCYTLRFGSIKITHLNSHTSKKFTPTIRAGSV